MKKIMLAALCLLFTSTLSFAKPNFLGRILTVGYVKANLINCTKKKGDYDRNDNSSPITDGELTFNDGNISYKIETDYRGRVTDEEQYLSPRSYDEMNSMINLLKSEGRVTSDQTNGASRTIALYLRYSSDVVIS